MIERYKKMSSATKAAFWALVAGVFQKGISVLATPVFTRILSTDEYAQYTLYQSWHDIFIIFTSLYVFNYATYTAMVKFENDKDGFISAAQSFVFYATAMGFVIYSIIHLAFGEVIGFSYPIVAMMFADMLFVSSFNLWAAKERYEFHYTLMTVLSLCIGALGPILGIVTTIFLGSLKGYARIYGMAIVNIIFGVVIFVKIYRKKRFFFHKEYFRYIFGFCFPLIPHFLSAQVLTRFDRIMINDICGASDTGIYSLAYSVSMLMSIVSDAILKAFTPWTYQAIKDKKEKSIKSSANYVILLVAVSNLILILFAPEAVRIFATEEYMSAIYIIPAVSASVYFIFLYNVFANIEYYYSETRFMPVASILAAGLNIFLNYIFIRKYGFIAAGYTTLTGYILYSLGHYFFMKRVEQKHANGYSYYNEKFIFFVSLIFTAISLAIVPLYNSLAVRYIIISMIALVLFFSRKKIFGIAMTIISKKKDSNNL